MSSACRGVSKIGLLSNLTIGRTLDLSHSGVGVELDHSLPVETRVSIDLELDDKILRILAKVRSAVGLEGGKSRLGVEFLSMGDEDRLLLELLKVDPGRREARG